MNAEELTVSEFRWDNLRGCWVIMLNSRQRLPREFMIERQRSEMLSCPFCPGQEAKTPHEVYALRPVHLPADSPGWQVRVVPNKFPILRIEGDLRQQQQGLHQSLPGIGAHEVIIETSDHERTLADLEVGEIADVLKAYRARLLDLRGDPRFRYLQIYKGHGIEAGAPVPHSHSQLIAVPIIPPLVQDLINNSRD
jgi:UDPglucose--hexose-1-phosphate uridylyltransferase